MTQDEALAILKTGTNVFLTGAPGAGKTHVVSEYRSWLEAAGLSVAVTASTGIAATHLGGMTIHSWSGIGVRDTLSQRDIEQITEKESVVKRIKRADALVIDEISMLDGSVLDMIEAVTRAARGGRLAFGGLQVVFVGDFFQLPPVSRRSETSRYAFHSRAWASAAPLTCYLTEQHRQKDELLLSLLSSIRADAVSEEHYALLREQTAIAYLGIEPTRLYTHNTDVDALNADKLAELKGARRSYRMKGKGGRSLQETLAKNCLSPQELVLKEEAAVMFTKNNFEAGYVNGTLARVVGFSGGGYPVVETKERRRITVAPASWEMIEDGKVLAAVEQIPLRLAWAITVHKSQGMSLDAAEVDLAKTFAFGQGYVALSRVRTLDGLKVVGLGSEALAVDPLVTEKDKEFRADAEAVAERFAREGKEALARAAEAFLTARGGKMPTKEKLDAKPRNERLKRESTTAQTLTLLKAGKSVREAAALRAFSETTIWNHVEMLARTGALSRAELLALVPSGVNWLEAYRALSLAIKKHGHEKLKPLYEATGERYDYPLVRLARLVYVIDSKDS
jgi:hypothetical protein